MKRLAYLTVSSPITIKGLFTKPLKFVIQIFTGAPEEHITHSVDGTIPNVAGEGMVYMIFAKWMKRYDINGARIHCYELIDDATDEQILAIKTRDKLDEGKPYGAIDAAFTANILESIIAFVKRIIFFFDKPSEKEIKKTLKAAEAHANKSVVCSCQNAHGLYDAKILPDIQWWLMSPTDLVKAMKKSGKFTKRRIN